MTNRKRFGALGAAALLLLLVSITVYWQVGGDDERARNAGSATGAVASAQLQQPSEPPEHARSAVEAAPVPAAADAAPDLAQAPQPVVTRRSAGARRAASAAPRNSAHEHEARAADDSVQDAGVSVAKDAAAAPVLAEKSSEPPKGNVVVRFRNAAGSNYELQRVVCRIGGKTVAVKKGSAVGAGTTTTIFTGSLPAARHTLAVVAEYRGDGGGIFSYFEGFRFNVQGTRAFTVEAGQATEVVVTTVERGGPTVRFEERLAMALRVR